MKEILCWVPKKDMKSFALVHLGISPERRQTERILNRISKWIGQERDVMFAPWKYKIQKLPISWDSNLDF